MICDSSYYERVTRRTASWIGVSHTNVNAAGVGEGNTSFSWVLGGEADYNIAKAWAGCVQLDLLHTNFFQSGQNHGRLSLGVVYRFGK